MYTTISLIRVENDDPGGLESLSHFCHEFQLGILLSLMEEGQLTEDRYRTAERALLKQYSQEGADH